MVILSGDNGIIFDNGNNAPGATLQRLERGEWIDYLIGGEPVFAPVDVQRLQQGEYRLAKSGTA